MALTFGSRSALTTTNLGTLANSATVGWTSDVIDFSSIHDLWVELTINFANTANADHKCVYVWGWASLDNTNFPTTGASSGGTPGVEGSLTFPSISTTPNNFGRPLVIPYVVTDQTITRTFAMSELLGTPAKYGGLAILNYSGAAFTSASIYTQTLNY